jgi:hypothetical protein
MSLIIAILIGHLTKDTKNIKKKEEDLRNFSESIPSTPERTDLCQHYSLF